MNGKKPLSSYWCLLFLPTEADGDKSSFKQKPVSSLVAPQVLPNVMSASWSLSSISCPCWQLSWLCVVLRGTTWSSTCRNKRMHVRGNASRHPVQVSSGAGHHMALKMFSLNCFWVCDALHCQLPLCQSIQLKSWRWE